MANNYIDRASPRFGDGWVEFPIVAYDTGRVIRFHKETIICKTLVYVEAATDSQDAVEETRLEYYRQQGKLEAVKANRATKPSR